MANRNVVTAGEMLYWLNEGKRALLLREDEKDWTEPLRQAVIEAITNLVRVVDGLYDSEAKVIPAAIALEFAIDATSDLAGSVKRRGRKAKVDEDEYRKGLAKSIVAGEVRGMIYDSKRRRIFDHE